MILALFLLIFLIASPHVHASLSLIADGDTVITIPTFDYFQYPSKHYEARGYPVFAKLVPADPDLPDPKRGNCKVLPAEPFPDGQAAKDIMENYQESIMIMQWNMASKCGAVTFSQLWPLAKEFAQDIEGAGLPPSNTLVISLSIRYKGLEANPYEEKYRSNLAGVNDGPPPNDLHVVSFGLTSGKEFIKADMEHRKEAKIAEYQVVQELDPWNAAFTSIAFRIFEWLFIILNIAFIGTACWRIVQIIQTGKFEFDLRNAIFVLGVVGATLYTVTLFLTIRSRSRRLVTNVSGYCETMAFHLLLYLWSMFMKQIRMQTKHAITVFRVVVFISMGVVTFTFIAQMIVHNVRTSASILRMVRVVEIVLPIMQFIIALTFALYSWQFYQKREAAKISPRTQTALFRLTILAVMAFVCYMFLSINNIGVVKDKLQQSPGMAVFGYYYLQVMFTLRNVSLLAILGVAAPKSDKSKGDATTSSVASRSRFNSVTSLKE
jgi:hypothetical protein